MIIDKIQSDDMGFVLVRFVKNDGTFLRKCFAPDADVSNEDQEVKDFCVTTWTPEIISVHQSQNIREE